MKKLLLLLGSALLLAGCQSAPKKTPPAAIINKDSKVQIVMPAAESAMGINRFVMEAAKMLQRALKESVGVNAAIVNENKAAGFNGMSIYLGNTGAIRKAGFEPAKFKQFDYVIAERNGDLYIAGADRPGFEKQKRITSSRDAFLGTLSGSIAFAEKYLNARFVMPGVVGEDYLPQKGIAIPGDLTYHGSPAIIFASGRANSTIYDYSTANAGRGGVKVYGGHSYYSAVPVKQYQKSHPEYFAANKSGERSGLGNHLCISNPEVQELIYREMLKQLDAGAETVELAQTDGYVPCQCAKCKAFGVPGDDYGEKTWILHRQLAERLRKERPGKKVLIICYPPNFNPPKSFSKFPDNVMIELCKYTEASFKEWSKIKVPQGFLVYIYNWGDYQVPGYTPKYNHHFVADQARLFRANNVKGVYRCGFGELFGLEGPVYYVYGKMLENPELNEDSLVNEYCERAFAESAAPMKTFFNTIHTRIAFYANARKDNYPLTQRSYFAAAYTPEVVDLLKTNLERAEKLAKQPKIKARLALVRAEFDYLKSITDVIHFYAGYRTRPCKETFELLAAAIDNRNAVVQKICPKNRASRFRMVPDVRFFDGAPKNYLLDNGRSAVLGAPFSWNVKLLREKNLLPGVGKKRMTVVKADGPVKFDDFNSGVWSRAKWEEMNGIQLGAIVEKTKFKAAYDQKNVYLAFVSDLDPKKSYLPLGSDGPCWRNDCLEIFLDPQGERQSFYHIIYTPVANSRYDESAGFITDPLHPLFGKRDASWNGKWSYQTRREGDKWYSLLTVPCSAIKTAVPKSGTIWTMNAGRESRIIGGSGNEMPELSSWSPDLESGAFGNAEAFGEMVFE